MQQYSGTFKFKKFISPELKIQIEKSIMKAVEYAKKFNIPISEPPLDNIECLFHWCSSFVIFIENVILHNYTDNREFISGGINVKISLNFNVILQIIEYSCKYSDQDIKTTKEKYEKSKIVNSIVHSFSDKTEKDPSYLYETLVWNLYDEYEHAYYAFQHIMNTNDMKMLGILPEKERHILVGEIRKRFTTPPEKIRADFELRCYTEEGIEAIREVLMSIEDPSIQIQLVSSPVFLIQTETTDKEGGLRLILQSLKKIEEGILKKGGIYKLTVEPKVLTDHDKNRLEDERMKMEEICEEEEGMDDEEYTPPECEQ